MSNRAGHYVTAAFRTELSAREKQVLSLVAQGWDNPQIGAHLYLTVDTVKSHMARLRRVLEARNRTHAVAIGITRGLITLPNEHQET